MINFNYKKVSNVDGSTTLLSNMYSFDFEAMGTMC